MVGVIEPIASTQPFAVNGTNPVASSPRDLPTANTETAPTANPQALPSSPLSPTTQAYLLTLRESGALAPLPGSPIPAAALQQGLSDLSVALSEIQAALNSAGQTQSVTTLSLAGIPLTSTILTTALSQLNAAINDLNVPGAISPGLLLYEQTLEALTTVAPPDAATAEPNPLTGLPHISAVV